LFSQYTRVKRKHAANTSANIIVSRERFFRMAVSMLFTTGKRVPRFVILLSIPSKRLRWDDITDIAAWACEMTESMFVFELWIALRSLNRLAADPFPD
jgi:hypothetical protein